MQSCTADGAASPELPLLLLLLLCHPARLLQEELVGRKLLGAQLVQRTLPLDGLQQRSSTKGWA